MSDKPQLAPNKTPVMEPNFERKDIEAPTWIRELWQNAANSCVLLETERRMSRSGSASGFFVDRTGYIVTNDHVVKNTTGIDVVTFDGQKFPADVIARLPSDDLAIIRLRNKTTPDSCKPMPIGESSTLKDGQQLVNVGHPRGTFFPHISLGRLERIGNPFMESTVPSVTGNSGGMTLNLEGRVVGVSKGVKFHTGRKETPRGDWISPKPSTEPETYSLDCSTTSVPAETLALFLAQTDRKFSVTRYNTGWSDDHLKWLKDNPMHVAIDAAGLGSATYLGSRFLHNYKRAAIGTGIASLSMLALDGYNYYDGPMYQAVKTTASMVADGVTIAGSILRAKYAKLGTAVTSIGLVGRLGTEFVPTGVRLRVNESY